MSSLSDKEINVTLSKIRNEYEEGAKKYGNKIYNIESFNDRYREALQNRQDLSNYLLLEINILEDIKNRLRERELEKERKEAEEKKPLKNILRNIFMLKPKKRYLIYPELLRNYTIVFAL